MIITPHLLVGAALGHHAPNAITAFGLGLISHFVLDNIAHWDYLSYIDLKNKDHLKKMSLDFSIAVILAAALVWRLPDLFCILAGITGALLPDALEVICKNFKISFLKPFSKFHLFLHHKKNLKLSEGWFGLVVIVAAAMFALLL